MTRQTRNWMKDAERDVDRDVERQRTVTLVAQNRRERLAFCCEFVTRNTEALSEAELTQLEAALWHERQRRSPATGEVLAVERPGSLGLWTLVILAVSALVALTVWSGR